MISAPKWYTTLDYFYIIGGNSESNNTVTILYKFQEMDCSSHSTHCHLIEPLSSPETPLLISSRSSKLTFRERLAQANCLPRRLCLPSKAAVLILFWTLVVSTIYTTIQKDTVTIVIRLREIEHPAMQKFDLLVMYLVFAVISLLYPLAGFLADVQYMVATGQSLPACTCYCAASH